MPEQQDSSEFVEDTRHKWNGDSGDDITIGAIVIDRDQPQSDIFKPPSVDPYSSSNTVLSKNYSVDHFAGVGAQQTGSLFGESSALFPSLGSPSQPSGSSYTETHKSNMFSDLAALDNEEFVSQYLPAGLGGANSVLQFPYSSPQQSAAAPSSDMGINFGYLEEQQQQRDALRMPSPNKAEQQRGAGASGAGAPPRPQPSYFDSRPEAGFKGAPANVDPSSAAGKSGPFGAMGAHSPQQQAAAGLPNEQQRAKQQHLSGSVEPESSRQARQAASSAASSGSALHSFDHHYQSASHEPALDSLQNLWNTNSDFLSNSTLFASASSANQRFGRDTGTLYIHCG